MDENTKHWNSIAREYDSLITRGDFFREHLLNPAMSGLLPPLRGRRVLDAGCGQGYFSEMMRVKGAHVVGLDAAESLISLAKERYSESSALTFMTHDLRDPLHFFNASFDGVVSNMVFMDFDPIDSAFREIGRVTKQGGFFIFSILHPFFMSGKVHKHISEMFELPHYELKRYATPFSKEWHIANTAYATTVYHRPLEYYTRMLSENGFVITAVHEPTLSPSLLTNRSNAEKLLSEIPMFLIVKAERRREE